MDGSGDFGTAARLMLMFTPMGGPTSTVTAIVDTDRFELMVNGPFGGVLVFQLDHTTMTGQVPDKVVCSNGST